MPDRDDGHCHGPECFRDDGDPVDVCACPCALCTEAIRKLLREQGEDPDEEEPHGDPSGLGASPVH